MVYYQFGRFKIDPQTVRLSQSGQPIELEPLAFETLLYLVENRQRVVAKDELLENIWKGRVLTEHVITRIIYLLRKVLDDSDSKESCLRTVRGKGYQFIADVQVVNTAEDRSPASLAIQQPQFKKWILGLVIIVLIATTVWMLYKPPKEVVKRNNYQSIVVLPLKNSGATDELTVFSASVVDYLTTQLSMNLKMKVIHPDSMLLLSNQFNDIWSIQQATGADYLLEGTLLKTSNDRIVIQLHLYEAENSELLPYDLGGFEFPYPRTTADLNQLYHKQRITIRDIIQLIKPGISPLENGQVRTEDPEAYRMIIRAHHLMRSDSCEGIYQAEMLQKQATERDPNYAYAWLQLLANYFKRVWVCGESTENYQRALAVAEKIEQLAPGQYEAVEIARNAILVETNHVEEAFEWVKDASWDNPAALSRKIYALRFAGFLKLARVHVDRILQLDPFFTMKNPFIKRLTQCFI
ncbi:MAG: winged helix-turn-helix domain-containing protein [Marinicella sp.]